MPFPSESSYKTNPSWSFRLQCPSRSCAKLSYKGDDDDVDNGDNGDNGDNDDDNINGLSVCNVPQDLAQSFLTKVTITCDDEDPADGDYKSQHVF